MPFKLVESRLQITTARFGPFLFQIGVDASQVELLYYRVSGAQQRFCGSPLSQVAHQLERGLTVSSVFGTNSIGRGVLSEEEIKRTLELDPLKVKDAEQRQAVNFKAAYGAALKAAADPH